MLSVMPFIATRNQLTPKIDHYRAYYVLAKEKNYKKINKLLN